MTKGQLMPRLIWFALVTAVVVCALIVLYDHGVL